MKNTRGNNRVQGPSFRHPYFERCQHRRPLLSSKTRSPMGVDDADSPHVILPELQSIGTPWIASRPKISSPRTVSFRYQNHRTISSKTSTIHLDDSTDDLESIDSPLSIVSVRYIDATPSLDSE